MLVYATTCSSVFTALVDYLAFPGLTISRGIFLLDWGTTIFVVGGVLAITRVVRERGRFSFFAGMREPTLIVGVNNSGEALLRELRRDKNLSYRVVGFVASDATRIGTRIGGVPILGTIQDTCRLAQQHGIHEVFITSGELSGQQVRQLMKNANRLAVQVRVIPSYEQLLQGRVAVQPRPVSIEDLLRREEVDLDLTKIHRWIDGKTILVTGSAGSIGSEICRQLLKFQPGRVVVVDRNETGQFYLEQELQRLGATRQIEVCLADLEDTRRMRALFDQYRPEVVFHAAAYKHVPLMEANVGEAVKNITLVTKHLADMADHFGVQSFVMISTDKAVNPTSVMGACKRAAELYVQALADVSECRFVTVRFGNVLDSAGSVVPLFRAQIAAGGPVTVTHRDMTRYFMTIPEAAQLVVQAGAMGQGGEIFVLEMGEPIRILDLATDMIRMSGLQVGEDVEIEIIGVRPGEKLYEELNVEGERHVSTSHPKIMVAASAPIKHGVLETALTRLARQTEFPQSMVVSELQRIVPEFCGAAHLANRRAAA